MYFPEEVFWCSSRTFQRQLTCAMVQNYGAPQGTVSEKKSLVEKKTYFCVFHLERILFFIYVEKFFFHLGRILFHLTQCTSGSVGDVLRILF